MKCQNCGAEMQKGYLQGGNMIAFNEHIHKVSLNPRDEGDIMLVRNLVKASCFSGGICRACGLITFDYTNSDVKEKA
ncbi:PF20097 family protein [Ruminococcaceae bacterium OttesenSCG-928-N02]|nr:PF20097 family protein [Ruminococcaceae bacterium OttesenSCG-928-N02]